MPRVKSVLITVCTYRKTFGNNALNSCHLMRTYQMSSFATVDDKTCAEARETSVELGVSGVHAACKEHVGPVYCDEHTQTAAGMIAARRPFQLHSCTPSASGTKYAQSAKYLSRSFNLMLIDMLLRQTCVSLTTAYWNLACALLATSV